MKVLSMTVGPIMTNCYILCDEEAGVCAVIDPGDEGDRIAHAVKKTGCELQYVLLTHGHHDHYTGLDDLLAHYDVPVYINEKDITDTHDDTNPFRLLFPRMDEAHQRYYQEGDVLKLGSLSIHVMETPGHSRGSVILLVDDVMFAGDTLFRGSCGRVDLRGGDYRAMLVSLARIGRLEGDYQVYPGHDRPTTLNSERQYNPYIRQALSLD